MPLATLTLTVDKPIARLYLNRPAIHNAFNPEVIRELHETFEELGQNPDVRIIVLSGHGKSFCAGADLNWMKAMVAYTFEENQADARKMALMFKTINECPKPVIGRINGAAIGGGMGLISVCDTVVAVESAQFGFSEVRLGLVPAVISSFVFPKIGPSQARALFLSGERFNTVKARDIGLIHHVVSVEELDPKIEQQIEQFLMAGPEAIATAKKMIHDLTPLNMETTMALNAIGIAERRASAEGQEGMTAFLEKRPANWNG